MPEQKPTSCGLAHVRQVRDLPLLNLRWWWGGRDESGLDFTHRCRLYGLGIGLRFLGVVVTERLHGK